MHEILIPLLACPACHGELTWSITERLGEHVETAEARCTSCGADYPVREGIGLFLTPDLPRRDLWEEVESQLLKHLREHPEVERQLMDVPLAALSPADQFFRALVLEERGDYAGAKAAEERANAQLYTPEYRACHESQMAYVLEQVADAPGPIVDLASGRGGLVERLARQVPQPIIASDFSLQVLRRNRRWLKFFGLHDRVSLLAFDARRTPFKDGAITTLTTNLGLPNIEEPGNLLQELRRVVSGTFLAISHFYPEDDEANAAVIHQLELSPLLFRRPALKQFGAAGWQVEAANPCRGLARPTPTGVVLEGAGIDALPVAETLLEWSVLVAR